MTNSGLAVSALALAWLAFAAPSANAQDSRQLVKMPAMMQEHMLANMRSHLASLNEMLDALAEGKTNEAAKIAEDRLGMSSLSLHGSAMLSKYMPEEMAALGTQMHHAASRFVIVAQDAELDPSVESQRKVYRALQQVTENCNACHQAYRLR